MDKNDDTRRTFMKSAAVATLLPGGALATAAQITPSTPSPAPQRAIRLLPGIEKIVKTRVLRVGIVAPEVQEFPPFYSREKNGELKGIDVEMVRGIAKALNVKLLIDRESDKFSTLVERVAEGNVDMAFCKLSKSVVRAMSVHFTLPYVEFSHALAVNRERFAELAKDKEPETIIKHFSGKLGVVGGTIWGERARLIFPLCKIVEFANYNDLLEATRTGKIHALYRDAFEIQKYFKIRPELNIPMRAFILSDLKDTICGVVAPQLSDLRQVVNIYIETTNKIYDTKTLLAMI